MSWQILILANIVLGAASYLLYRSLARKYRSKNSSLAITGGFYLAQFIPVFFIPYYWQHINYQQMGHYWPWLVGGGIGFALANLLVYKLLNYLDAGISSLLGTLNVIFTGIFAYLILHEGLSYRQLAGCGILLGSISYILLIASRPGKHRSHKHSWIIGLAIATIGGIIYSLSAVNEKFLIEHINFGTYIVVGWAMQVLAAQLLPLALAPKSYALLKRSTVWPNVIAGGALRGLAGLLYLSALKDSSNVALIQIAMNFRLVVIILVGAWLLKEHHKLKEKLAAAAISLVGLTVILWK